MARQPDRARRVADRRRRDEPDRGRHRRGQGSGGGGCGRSPISPREGGATFTSETYQGVELQVAEGSAYAFVEEMLVIGQTAEGIQAVVDVQAGGDALADRADFRDTMENLAADHLASLFVDLAALAQATDTSDELSSVSTAGAALVAEPDGLRLSGSAPFAADEAASSAGTGFALGSEPSSLVDWMPESTIAELVIFGLRETRSRAPRKPLHRRPRGRR